jgi:hypothetical protein
MGSFTISSFVFGFLAIPKKTISSYLISCTLFLARIPLRRF